MGKIVFDGTTTKLVVDMWNNGDGVSTISRKINESGADIKEHHIQHLLKSLGLSRTREEAMKAKNGNYRSFRENKFGFTS